MAVGGRQLRLARAKTAHGGRARLAGERDSQRARLAESATRQERDSTQERDSQCRATLIMSPFVLVKNVPPFEPLPFPPRKLSASRWDQSRLPFGARKGGARP